MSNPAHTKNAPDAGQGVEGSDRSPNRQEGTTVMHSMPHPTDKPHPPRPHRIDVVHLDAWGPEHDEPVPYAPTDPEPPAALAPVVSLDAYRARRELRAVGQVAA